MYLDALSQMDLLLDGQTRIYRLTGIIYLAHSLWMDLLSCLIYLAHLLWIDLLSRSASLIYMD